MRAARISRRARKRVHHFAAPVYRAKPSPVCPNPLPRRSHRLFGLSRSIDFVLLPRNTTTNPPTMPVRIHIRIRWKLCRVPPLFRACQPISLFRQAFVFSPSTICPSGRWRFRRPTLVILCFVSVFALFAWQIRRRIALQLYARSTVVASARPPNLVSEKSAVSTWASARGVVPFLAEPPCCLRAASPRI